MTATNFDRADYTSDRIEELKGQRKFFQSRYEGLEDEIFKLQHLLQHASEQVDRIDAEIDQEYEDIKQDVALQG